MLLQTIFRQEDASLRAALSEVRRAQDGACAPSLQPYAPSPAALCALPATLCVQVRRAQDGFCLSRATQRVLRACTPAAAAAAAIAATASATGAASTGDAGDGAGGAGGAGCERGGAARGAAGGEEEWCRLFATNAECDALNSRRLCALHGAARAYEARLVE